MGSGLRSFTSVPGGSPGFTVSVLVNSGVGFTINYVGASDATLPHGRFFERAILDVGGFLFNGTYYILCTHGKQRQNIQRALTYYAIWHCGLCNYGIPKRVTFNATFPRDFVITSGIHWAAPYGSGFFCRRQSVATLPPSPASARALSPTAVDSTVNSINLLVNTAVSTSPSLPDASPSAGTKQDDPKSPVATELTTADDISSAPVTPTHATPVAGANGGSPVKQKPPTAAKPVRRRSGRSATSTTSGATKANE